MATIASAEGARLVFLRPCILTDPIEGWVTVQLVIRSDAGSLDVSGEFLRLDELHELDSGVRQVLAGRSQHYVLDPVEPNFQFKIESLDSGYRIDTRYLQSITYADASIDFGRSKSVAVEIHQTADQIRMFADQLRAELASLVKPAG